MNPIRRSLVTSLAAAPALLVPARFAMAADPLKISHQFPCNRSWRAIRRIPRCSFTACTACAPAVCMRC